MTAGSGLLVVDKPAGWTSHDVVARARRICGTRRVGHAGTLDPMATGVLVLGVERATRLLTFLVGCDKSYAATIRLGQATVTDDAEGEPTSSTGVTSRAGQPSVPSVPSVLPTLSALPAAVAALTGEIEQVPSAVSAIKVGGERSYVLARRGEPALLRARPVTVSRFDVVDSRSATVTLDDGKSIDVLDLDVVVDVSSGTYVRALARDLGDALGVGGHLTALRRTRVGPFDLTAATPLDELTARAEREGVSGIPLVSLADAARAQLPVHDVSEQDAVRLRHGQRIASGAERSDAVAAINPTGRLVAVLDETRETARPRVVFPVDD